jgi:hypothetical protein
MELIFRSPDINEVNIVKSILDNNDITCALRNENLEAATGAFMTEVWPEVWIMNDLDAERAIELIETRNKPSGKPDWICPNCGEKIEGTFDACWKCGAFRADKEETSKTGD